MVDFTRSVLTAPPRSKHLLRGFIAALLLIGGSGLAVSCLTPDFEFGSGVLQGQGGERTLDPCDNRRLDEGETGIDCGGPCPQCPLGSPCVIRRDCEAPPSNDPALVECLDGTCVLVCQRNYADCNGRAVDGCEINLLADLENCGACNQLCSPAHAVGQCMNGQCLIDTASANQGCALGYANCNRNVEDGCEVDLANDPDHCGACEDAACSRANGEATCSDGACSVECSPGFADCDENARANGCETKIASSVNDCGQCGTICPDSGANWFPFCKEGVCGETECFMNMGDCDGDGTCSDALDSTDNCGGCGITCSARNGSTACAGDSCIIAACDETESATWADCDGDYATGCEVNTKTNRLRCGGCLAEQGGSGEDCSLQEGMQHVAVTSCVDGACGVANCEAGWVDCDGVFANGCEVNTETDEANCGGCAEAGGAVCAPKPHTPSECTAGSCDYSCDVGWSDRNGDRYDALSDGCEELTLSLINAGAWDSSDTGGSGPGVTVGHALEGVRGTQRLVLVSVLCRGGSVEACAVTAASYGGVELQRLAPNDDVFMTDSGAQLFYLLDAELPGPGTYPVIIDRNDEWGSLSVEVVEFSGAEQDTFFADVGTVANPAHCDTGLDATILLSGLPPGSAVYVFGGGNHESAASRASTSAPLTLSKSEIDDFIVFGSAYAAPVSGEVSAQLDFTGCFRSVAYAVAVRPESNY